MIASVYFNYCYSCVKILKCFYKEQHHSTRFHGLFVLSPYSIHQPSRLQKYSHATDTYKSHMQVYPWIFPIGFTDVPHLACWIFWLSIMVSFYLTSSRPSVFFHFDFWFNICFLFFNSSRLCLLWSWCVFL